MKSRVWHQSHTSINSQSTFSRENFVPVENRRELIVVARHRICYLHFLFPVHSDSMIHLTSFLLTLVLTSKLDKNRNEIDISFYLLSLLLTYNPMKKHELFPYMIMLNDNRIPCFIDLCINFSPSQTLQYVLSPHPSLLIDFHQPWAFDPHHLPP